MQDNHNVSPTKRRQNANLIARYRYFLQEWLLSIPLVVGYFLSTRNFVTIIVIFSGWFVMGLATGIACHLGSLARQECRDIRFVCFSLYRKYPAWLNWLFISICIGVLVKPIFALSVYIASGLAFYRGYAFKRVEKKAWVILFLDLLIRLAGGIVLGRI